MAVLVFLFAACAHAENYNLNLPATTTSTVKVGCQSSNYKPELKSYTEGASTVTVGCMKVSATPAPTTVTVLDGFERPEYAADSDFKGSVTRVVARNQVTGFVVKSSQPCSFRVTAPAGLTYEVFKMHESKVTYPSYTGGKTGLFYDALVPYNATNCVGAKYLWVDVSIAKDKAVGLSNVTLGDALATLDIKSAVIPDKATMPLYSLFSNSMMYFGWYGKWAPVEARGIEFTKLMVSHRMAPYNSAAVTPTVSNGTLLLNSPTTELGYKNLYLDFATHEVFWPNYSDAASIKAVQVASGGKGWFYSKDEPQESEIAELKTYLQLQKDNAPGIKRMVTHQYRQDLDGLVNIWTPVAEYYCTKNWDGTNFPCEQDYSGHGETWLYVSCMSHGCGPDRNGNLNASTVAGSDSGAPDLVLDRSSSHPFGLFLLAAKYPSLKGLLYYNTVEQWKLFPQGSDMWKDDLFNFGGNLDGTLFWPGRPGIEGLTTYEAITSVRMKLIREASYLYDVLSMVPDRAWVKSQVDSLVTNPKDWKRDIKLIEKLRNDALLKLL